MGSISPYHNNALGGVPLGASKMGGMKLVGGGAHSALGAHSFSNRMSHGTDPRLGNRGARLDLWADDDDRYESFILGDGEKKVEVDPETRE